MTRQTVAISCKRSTKKSFVGAQEKNLKIVQIVYHSGHLHILVPYDHWLRYRRGTGGIASRTSSTWSRSHKCIQLAIELLRRLRLFALLWSSASCWRNNARSTPPTSSTPTSCSLWRASASSESVVEGRLDVDHDRGNLSRCFEGVNGHSRGNHSTISRPFLRRPQSRNQWRLFSPTGARQSHSCYQGGFRSTRRTRRNRRGTRPANWRTLSIVFDG